MLICIIDCILTCPGLLGEASKDIRSTFHNCDCGSFVVAFRVKGLTCETVSRSSEQKTPFTFQICRQPAFQTLLMFFTRQNLRFFKFKRIDVLTRPVFLEPDKIQLLCEVRREMLPLPVKSIHHHEDS